MFAGGEENGRVAVAEIVRPRSWQFIGLQERVELTTDVPFVQRRSNRRGERVARLTPS